MAIEKGFFSEKQITVSLTSSSTPTGTLLLSGAAQISSGQPTFTYVPNSQGADLVAIYSPAATYEVWIAKPPITDPKQLEGKIIGVFSLQDLDVVYTKQLMDENGLKPGSYTLFAAGATNNKLAAVVAGQVAAAPLYPPANFVAKQQGLVEIFNTSQLKFGQVPTFYEVRRSWASQHPVAVVNVIRALNKAHNWLFDRANRAEAMIGAIDRTVSRSPSTSILSFGTGRVLVTTISLRGDSAIRWTALPERIGWVETA